ncbi:hypothetical protein D3C72_1434510 [compost metagenome]
MRGAFDFVSEYSVKGPAVHVDKYSRKYERIWRGSCASIFAKQLAISEYETSGADYLLPGLIPVVRTSLGDSDFV